MTNSAFNLILKILYYYDARYLDLQNLPKMGGIFNIVNMHAYYYAGNNPVKYVDPDGRLIRHLSCQRQGFDTMREAAIHILNFINPISIEYNIEFTGFIYRDSNDGKYYAILLSETRILE